MKYCQGSGALVRSGYAVSAWRREVEEGPWPLMLTPTVMIRSGRGEISAVDLAGDGYD